MAGLESSWSLNGDQGALTTWARAIVNETGNIKLQRWLDSPPGDACGWEGVECGIVNGEARITGINLTNSSIAGSMPLGLGQLTGLITLVAPMNKFNGSIPVDLGNCIHLEVAIASLLEMAQFRVTHPCKGFSVRLFANCMRSGVSVIFVRKFQGS